jgi:hypothetical protein
MSCIRTTSLSSLTVSFGTGSSDIDPSNTIPSDTIYS